MRIEKRIISIIIVFTLLVSCIPLFGFTNVYAEEAAEEEYTEISCIDDLALIRANLSGNFILTADLDLTEATAPGGYLDQGYGWVPISEFTGKLDGNGHYQGGGFGIKGSVKGMITAYIMNSGLDYIRSFSDDKRERQDNADVRSKKWELRKKIISGEYHKRAFESIVDGIRYAFFDVLYEEGVLKNQWDYDKDRAIIVCNNILASNNSINYKKAKIVECLITTYPFLPEMYKKLLDIETDVSIKREIIRLAKFFRSDDYCSLANIKETKSVSSGIGLKRKR